MSPDLFGKILSRCWLPFVDSSTISPETSTNGCEGKVLVGKSVRVAHWALEQSLGGRKQSSPVGILLGWILFEPFNEGESSKRNINHIEAEVDPLTTQLD